MKCIIVEGPQGCGKTTLTNYLRENIPAANLYRLTGHKDKTITGKEKSKKMYMALLDYMKSLEDCDVNLIFDRTFFTDYIYSNLGYKEYDYKDVYKKLLTKFGELNYDIYYISLYLEDTNIFKQRLIRDHHNYQDFSVESSINQQNEYKKVLKDLEKLKNTKVFEVAMDDFDKAYTKINEILNINKQ